MNRVYVKYIPSVETKIAARTLKVRPFPETYDKKQHIKSAPCVKDIVGQSWFVTWLFMFSGDMVFCLNDEYNGFLTQC